MQENCRMCTANWHVNTRITVMFTCKLSPASAETEGLQRKGCEVIVISAPDRGLHRMKNRYSAVIRESLGTQEICHMTKPGMRIAH